MAVKSKSYSQQLLKIHIVGYNYDNQICIYIPQGNFNTDFWLDRYSCLSFTVLQCSRWPTVESIWNYRATI